MGKDLKAQALCLGKAETCCPRAMTATFFVVLRSSPEGVAKWSWRSAFKH
jgi:hypothetical protein